MLGGELNNHGHVCCLSQLSRENIFLLIFFFAEDRMKTAKYFCFDSVKRVCSVLEHKRIFEVLTQI